MLRFPRRHVLRHSQSALPYSFGRGLKDAAAENSEATQLAGHEEAQRSLNATSASIMSINYTRDHHGNYALRWLRGFTIDVNYDFKHWRRHQRATRHLELWTPRGMLRADSIRRLMFPELALVSLTSTALCYYNAIVASPLEPTLVTLQEWTPHLHAAVLSLPIEVFTISSFALGLLTTFKTQSCYGRFEKGRSLWAHLGIEARAFCSRLLTRVPSPSVKATFEVERSQEMAVKLVRTFALSLKYHLTEDGCNPQIMIHARMPEDELRAATTLAFRSELSRIWDLEDEDEQAYCQRILAGELTQRPLLILHELSHLNSTVFCHPQLGGLDPPAATEMDKSIASLHKVLGSCEQLLRTPVYSSYTRFTSRFLWLWCNTLPLALYGLLGPFATPPVSVAIAFVMFGIEDIGSRVEQPFDVLPLWQYCQTIDQSLSQLVRHNELLRGPSLSEEADEDDIERLPDLNLRSFIDPLQVPDEILGVGSVRHYL
eukprot:TRINITY_DN31422_c0_g1_i2.p1 TRINITY_DN31422_c0_g1~~TRINITY_DN31422_c0_g1_i2.p1  ORF type:complete len:487 (-),score=97.75 TRINITY_DN31422_c0_g1_i2:251-1711(-)